MPPIKELLKRTEEHIKGMVVPGTLFEELGFNYIGPVDGHDVLGLVSTLKNMRDLKGPQFLHIMTKKGRGYEPAEKDPITFHAVPKFDHTSGVLPKSSGGLPSYSKIFGDWLCETAAKDNKLMAITPAMREGSGMVEFSKKFPDRYFDVAIAEQHAVTFAAGLAIGDYKPVVAIYSTFLQRAYDQVIHDVAIQKLPVLFAIDRAGIVGADGQTHQGAFDLSFLRCIPDMVVMTPSDENECRQMLYTGYHYSDGPCAVRYPRGSGTGATPRAAGIAADRQRGGETSGRENSDPQLWHPAAGSRGGSGKTQRHPRGYALCEAAGYRANPPAGRRARRAGDAGRERHHGRRRQRRERSADGPPPGGTGAQYWPAGLFYPSGHSGRDPRRPRP